MGLATYGICLLYSVAKRSYRVIRQHQMPWDAVVSGSLVEIEIYIRVAPLVDQSGHRIRYELCSIRIIDDNVLQMQS